jgi:hypothetical protein
MTIFQGLELKNNVILRFCRRITLNQTSLRGKTLAVRRQGYVIMTIQV